MKIALSVLAAALGLVACATSHVSPVAKFETKRICVIENPKGGDFLNAYRKALEDRGFQVQLFPESAQPDVCPVTSRYVAYFHESRGRLCMEQAEIDVYSDGKHTGRAAFFGDTFMKFCITERKVKEVVGQLFPR